MLVSVFWWVELNFFSLKCNEVSSNELCDVNGFGLTLGCLYIEAQGYVPVLLENLHAKRMRFRHVDSSTFRLSRKTFSITYGSGRIEGFVAHDTVRIGDLVSTDQQFGLCTEESGFEGMIFDGILGLSYTNISSYMGAIPIFYKLKNEGAISEPVFAFYLSKDEREGSVVMFGGVDHRYYKGKLNWIPLTKADDWIVHMDR
ncbi:hypothetical protein AB1E18_019205 [Capra hircus]